MTQSQTLRPGRRASPGLIARVGASQAPFVAGLLRVPRETPARDSDGGGCDG